MKKMEIWLYVNVPTIGLEILVRQKVKNIFMITNIFQEYRRNTRRIVLELKVCDYLKNICLDVSTIKKPYVLKFVVTTSSLHNTTSEKNKD